MAKGPELPRRKHRVAYTVTGARTTGRETDKERGYLKGGRRDRGEKMVGKREGIQEEGGRNIGASEAVQVRY